MTQMLGAIRAAACSRVLRACCRRVADARRFLVLIVVPLLVVERGRPQLTPLRARPPFHIAEATVEDIHRALSTGQVTCRTLVALYLKRIQAYDHAGPALNTIQNVNPTALGEADRLDEAFRASGFTGPLHCIPVVVKDQVDTRDLPTTFGSILFRNFVPLEDATVVTRLRNAGAVILAKTTMGEFAAGFLGSGFGIVRNAYDPHRYASGSSGGTASAIAANFASVGIGEDTGGSIRGPAAVNALVGLRPTVPLVSRFGLLPARPTIDTLGPITRTVREAAILLDVLAGYDPQDPVTAYAVGHIPASYTASLSTEGLKGTRLGFISAPMDPRADPSSDEYKRFRVVTNQAISDLRALGAEVIDAPAPPDLNERIRKLYEENIFETDRAMSNYFALHPNAPLKSLADILASGSVVPARVAALRRTLGRSVEEAGYLKLLLLQEETRRLVLNLMAQRDFDAIVYATFDHPPAVISADALTNAKTDLQGLGNNRRLSPVLGFPALTVPAGFTDQGLPVGIEFMGRPFAETTLLRIGYAYEQGTHHRKPPKSVPPLRNEP
ncbi:MAG: gatA 6 [Bryobacterales bacterium]|nr:gatA 6 [Bryobacterales bacterium]